MKSLRSTALVLMAVVLAMSANASTLEEASSGFVSYQFDGASHHDAPDGCGAADKEWSAPLGAQTDGMLVAPDDVSDVFVVDVSHGLRGQRLHVDLTEQTGQVIDTLAVTAFVPGCSSTVLDLTNWPSPEPSPPQPSAGEAQHSADLSAPWRCDSRTWLFTIDRLQGLPAPSSIYLAWTDGTEKPVALQNRYGNVAVYSTHENLGVLLKGAWANLPVAWSGTFGFAVGPCDAVDGGAVYGTPPVVGMGFLEFTPVTAGQYVLQVTYEGKSSRVVMPIPAPVTIDPEPCVPLEPADVTDGTPLQGLIGHEPGAEESEDEPSLDDCVAALPTSVDPVVVPASCHWCVGAGEDVWTMISYDLRLSAS